MIFQHVAAVIGLICCAAYFSERLGLADLPGIPTDYMVAGLITFGVVLLRWRTDSKNETVAIDG